MMVVFQGPPSQLPKVSCIVLYRPWKESIEHAVLVYNTVKYYCGMGTSALNREVSFIQSVGSREVPV